MLAVVELDDDGAAFEDLDWRFEVDPVDFAILVVDGPDTEIVCEPDEDVLEAVSELLELLECVVLMTVAFPEVTEA